MAIRVRYVGIAIPRWKGKTGEVTSETAQYYLVRFDEAECGTVAINKQNVEFI